MWHVCKTRGGGGGERERERADGRQGVRLTLAVESSLSRVESVDSMSL